MFRSEIMCIFAAKINKLLMNRIYKFLLIAVTALLAVGCTNKKQETDKSMNNQKILVVYYSQTHATEEMAKYIQQKLNCDIESIELVDPYDPDYDSTIARGKRELDAKEWPEILPLKAKVEDYDVIFIGFPVWFSTYANPIASWLEKVDLKAKKVVPFATFGSGGLRSSVENLKIAEPGVEILTTIGCRRALMEMMPETVDNALINAGLVDGKAEELLPYSEQKELTAEEKEVFNKAVGDYPMLKARPLTCGTCERKKGTDYLFIAENSFGGNVSNVEVFVTAPKDGEPFFTLVERQ